MLSRLPKCPNVMQDCKHNIGNVCSINVLAEDWKKHEYKKGEIYVDHKCCKCCEFFYIRNLFLDLSTMYIILCSIKYGIEVIEIEHPEALYLWISPKVKRRSEEILDKFKNIDCSR